MCRILNSSLHSSIALHLLTFRLLREIRFSFQHMWNGMKWRKKIQVNELSNRETISVSHFELFSFACTWANDQKAFELYSHVFKHSSMRETINKFIRQFSQIFFGWRNFLPLILEFYERNIFKRISISFHSHSQAKLLCIAYRILHPVY